MALKIPNEQHFPMTAIEVAETVLRAKELREKGQLEEAERLRCTIPLLPEVAKVMKRAVGIEFMLSKNVNLYPALIEFGDKFLES